MEYGGSDVTRCFHWLLQRSGFNPKEIDLNKITDCLIMQEMKESYCHLDQVNKRVFFVCGGVQNASLILHFPPPSDEELNISNSIYFSFYSLKLRE